MGDVDHPHDAKDQCQSHGEHGVNTALHEATHHHRRQIGEPLHVVKNIVGHYSDSEWHCVDENQESS
ncbi:MAG: hypothetical protein GWP74_12540 [Proteobacteria bacterium]|jgi:hypothetical protein|nr:hypothetical protein [Pseudomonadota bacterium]